MRSGKNRPQPKTSEQIAPFINLLKARKRQIKSAPSKPKSLLHRVFNTLKRPVLGFLLCSLIAVLLLRFIPPLTTAFMVERFTKGLFTPGLRAAVSYHWVSRKEISPHLALAAMAAEDQKFPEHFGFDFEAIADALEEMEDGGKLRGGSTISQQVAKNLFLWKGKNFVRKGLEAYFTVLIELLWSKQRILEVYLNIAEFGDGIYGVDAAARKFFHKPPKKLTRHESALLAAVLPNPIRFKVAAPSAYIQRRAQKIERQMNNLGAAYLKGVWSHSALPHRLFQHTPPSRKRPATIICDTMGNLRIRIL